MMRNTMTAQEALLHLRYTAWASRRLIQAVRELPVEKHSTDHQISHASLIGTLCHTFFADAVWYMRAVDPSLPYPNPKEVIPLEELEPRWNALLDKWEAWAQSLTDSDLDRVVTFRFMDGNTGSTLLKHVILHVVNHGTLHRGQVVALIRQAGVKPPGTDLIYYYRELGAAAQTG